MKIEKSVIVVNENVRKDSTLLRKTMLKTQIGDV